MNPKRGHGSTTEMITAGRMSTSRAREQWEEPGGYFVLDM
jgi:hypothetical protein